MKYNEKTGVNQLEVGDKLIVAYGTIHDRDGITPIEVTITKVGRMYAQTDKNYIEIHATDKENGYFKTKRNQQGYEFKVHTTMREFEVEQKFQRLRRKLELEVVGKLREASDYTVEQIAKMLGIKVD